jgi:hypothetical protein
VSRAPALTPPATGPRAVFWTLALAILAGRVYTYDLPTVQTVAAHAAQVLALR